ncbi:MAG TPA: DUF2059 domain-containing protein [Rhizomicrobium sp.]|jgi:hypothetical protein|nr:DUF2059 domain-containing protein [Rhizomicrobium sp.]
MRLSPAFALLFAASLAVTGAQAADTLTLARKLVQYTGGVSAILHNFEGGMAQKTAAPDVFVQSFLQASVENKTVLDAADEKLAQAYAKIYPADLMADEIAFYESPVAQAIMTKSKDTYGAIVWPDPNSPGVSAEQGAALTKFHAIVKRRAAIAANNMEAADAILAAETDALVKIRTAAFANYCKVRDCKAENVIVPQ